MVFDPFKIIATIGYLTEPTQKREKGDNGNKQASGPAVQCLWFGQHKHNGPDASTLRLGKASTPSTIRKNAKAELSRQDTKKTHFAILFFSTQIFLLGVLAPWRLNSAFIAFPFFRNFPVLPLQRRCQALCTCKINALEIIVTFQPIGGLADFLHGGRNWRRMARPSEVNWEEAALRTEASNSRGDSGAGCQIT